MYYKSQRTREAQDRNENMFYWFLLFTQQPTERQIEFSDVLQNKALILCKDYY